MISAAWLHCSHKAHKHTQSVFSSLSLMHTLSHTHTQGKQKHTYTQTFLSFFPSPHILLYFYTLSLSYRQYGYLSNSTLSLLPLATKPISYISGGMKPSQMKTMKIFWRELHDFFIVCFHGIKHYICK